jgi:hypothetical protein
LTVAEKRETLMRHDLVECPATWKEQSEISVRGQGQGRVRIREYEAIIANERTSMAQLFEREQKSELACILNP